jgi:hypothetical protein
MKARLSASRPLGITIKTRKLLDCQERAMREAEPGLGCQVRRGCLSSTRQMADYQSHGT